MPTVAAQITGSAMVASDQQYIRLQGIDVGNDGIKFFDTLSFAFKITVFASAIGVLEVNKEKVVFIPVFPE